MKIWLQKTETNASPAGEAPRGAPTLPSDSFQSAFLAAIAVFAGASVMIIELAGIRILSPWFGNSLYTWTGLIGVILCSMSCGYYVGGRLADKHPHYVGLAHLLAIAGIFTLLIPFIYPFLEEKMGTAHLIAGPVAASLLLFALPGCLLAAVSPFSVRLMSLLTRDAKVGISSGSISMYASLGSVLGTFGAGFWLIPHLRLQTLFLIIGAILCLFAIAGYGLFAMPRGRKARLLAGFCLIFGAAMYAQPHAQATRTASTIYEQTSYYHRIRVSEDQTATGVTRRLLHLDSTTEGGQYQNARGLPINYQNYWELTKVFCPQIKSALFLGGGGFGMPKAMQNAFPQCRIEVIELDPMVIEVGRKYFGIEHYPRIRVLAGDARRYLRNTGQSYDFILGDAFHGVHNIPAHLVTVEFFELIRQRLTDQGIYMMNIISAVDGDRSGLFHAVTNTLAQAFSHIEVFALNPDQRMHLQILLILASKEALPVESLSTTALLEPRAKRILLKSYLRPDQYRISKRVTLTDEFNPVEYIVSSARRNQEVRHGN